MQGSARASPVPKPARIVAADFAAPLVYNHSMTALLDLGLHALRSAYCAGTLDVRRTIEEVLKRIAAAGDDKVWISRVPDAALRAQAATLDARRGDIDAAAALRRARSR